MTTWQADFYHYFPQNHPQSTQWQLTLCDEQAQVILETACPQSQANSQWLIQQLSHLSLPKVIKIFRPQIFNLFSLVGETMGFKVMPTRRTEALKDLLLQKYQSSGYNPVQLDQPPPQPLPETLWGENWRFASFPAGEIISYFSSQPIPILEINANDDPLNLGIASNNRLGGIIIEAGRKSMMLARWLGENSPYGINYIPTEQGQSGGLVLESGLVDRWILATFEDSEIASAAQQYEQRKQDNQGLHFLLVQPDDSGMTYSGFWLLKSL